MCRVTAKGTLSWVHFFLIHKHQKLISNKYFSKDDNILAQLWFGYFGTNE